MHCQTVIISEIEEACDMGGLNFLLLCRKCFEDGIFVVKNDKKRNFLTKKKTKRRRKFN